MSLKRRPPPGNVRRVAAIDGNLRGVITNKTGRLVQFESFAERSLLLRLDRDPTVKDYSSQPETFQGMAPDGKTQRYTPDFIVWRCDGVTEIHEVTLTSRRTSPSSQHRESLAVEICQARGWSYLVHTEETLPEGSELANLLALFRYRPTAYRNQHVTAVIEEQLRPIGHTALCKLLPELLQDTHLPPATVNAAVCHLLWHGEVLTDLHASLWRSGALMPDASVWLPTKETTNDDIIS